MILHGLENPNFERADTLSKSFKAKDAYNIILANPPFTGNVDTGDLNETRPWRSGKKVLSNKSELLFVWLILDLLEVGGRAAIIVPEGVLFGSTNAHKELRRQLILDHRLQGIISLPAGVFQPYTGVKTSIIVFEKVGRAKGEPIKTEKVWFYEVRADGFSLDAKRNPTPEQNDLWDALEKWQTKPDTSLEYYQPEVWTERWRMIDEKARRAFTDALSMYNDQDTYPVHDLFPELRPETGKPEPKSYTDKVRAKLQEAVHALYQNYLTGALPAASQKASDKTTDRQKLKAAEDVLKQQLNKLKGFFRETATLYLEQEQKHEPYANDMLRDVQKIVEEGIGAEIQTLAEQAVSQANLFSDGDNASETLDDDQAKKAVQEAVRIAAQIDGYNLQLRSLDVTQREEPLEESKCWTAAVRTFVDTPDWKNKEGEVVGSHDENGELRPAFLSDPDIYDRNGSVKEEYLDIDCIEANDYNLSAGRYKPFTLKTQEYDPPAQIIRELQVMEKELLGDLDELLKLVGTPS